MFRVAVALGTALAVAGVAAGCGGSGPSGRGGVPAAARAAQPAPGGQTRSRPPATCPAGTVRPVGGPNRALAAVVERPTTVYREPGGPPRARFGRLNVNHYPTVFSVLAERLDAACRATWLRVELPIRPNGATGWVRRAGLSLFSVRTRIVVDLSRRRLVLYRAGRAVLRARVTVGAPSTPTPVGRYYVNQRLLARDPAGPFGPAAVGISAYSPVLTSWAQGGPIAIHGTNEPWLIGQAASHGCIRLANRVLRRVLAATPAGTPVVIRR